MRTGDGLVEQQVQQHGTPEQVHEFHYPPEAADGIIEVVNRCGCSVWTLTLDETGHVTSRVLVAGANTWSYDYAFNDAGERIARTAPSNTWATWTFDDQNADPLHRGDLLEHRRLGSTSDLIESWTWTTGSAPCLVKTATNLHGHTTSHYYDFEEATLGDLNGDGTRNIEIEVLSSTADTFMRRAHMDQIGPARLAPNSSLNQAGSSVRVVK